MRAHVAAIDAALQPLAITVHRYAAPDVIGQYFVIGAPGGAADVESALCGPDESLDTEIRLTAVVGTPGGVAIMLDNARGILSPGRQWTQLSVPGRSAHLQFVRSEFIGIDESMTFTGTDRHPAWGTETYRLVSDPT